VVDEDPGVRAEPVGVLAGLHRGRRHRVTVRPSHTVTNNGANSSPWSGKPLDGPGGSAAPWRCSRWRHRGCSVA
jgi:hypothetical protein